MEVVVLAVIFGTIFGIAYLYFSTRNKERMALIEKGADASIFVRGKREHAAPIWKIFVINIAFLFMGIGTGVLLALILREYTTLGEGVFPALIFLMAGIGLYVGFTQTKKVVD